MEYECSVRHCRCFFLPRKKKAQLLLHIFVVRRRLPSREVTIRGRTGSAKSFAARTAPAPENIPFYILRTCELRCSRLRPCLTEYKNSADNHEINKRPLNIEPALDTASTNKHASWGRPRRWETAHLEASAPLTFSTHDRGGRHFPVPLQQKTGCWACRYPVSSCRDRVRMVGLGGGSDLFERATLCLSVCLPACA